MYTCAFIYNTTSLQTNYDSSLNKLTIISINENSYPVNIDFNFIDLSLNTGNIYQSNSVLDCSNILTTDFSSLTEYELEAESIYTFNIDISFNPPPSRPNV